MPRTLIDVWLSLGAGERTRVRLINVYPDSSDATVVAECLDKEEAPISKSELDEGWDDKTVAELENQSIELASLLPAALAAFWPSKTNVVI